jgi:hypothetical protein
MLSVGRASPLGKTRLSAISELGDASDPKQTDALSEAAYSISGSSMIQCCVGKAPDAFRAKPAKSESLRGIEAKLSGAC